MSDYLPHPRTRSRATALGCMLVAAAALAPWTGPASATTLGARCFISGGGTIAGDEFGGHGAAYRARPGDDELTFDGRWTHVAPGGRTLHGDIDDVVCRRNGGNPEHPTVQFSIAQFEGTGTFDGQDANFFITAQDHGEPGDDDRYRLLIADPDDDTIIYAIAGIMDSGNFQIHPANNGHP